MAEPTAAFKDAVGTTEAVRVNKLKRPVVRVAPEGEVSLGGLPLTVVMPGANKKTHAFFDVIRGYDGEIDIKSVHAIIVEQRFAEPFRMKDVCLAPYTMQVAVLPDAGRKIETIKHVVFEGDLRAHSDTIPLLASGGVHVLNFGKQQRVEARALQHLFERLGGDQVRAWGLVPLNAPSTSRILSFSLTGGPGWMKIAQNLRMVMQSSRGLRRASALPKVLCFAGALRSARGICTRRFATPRILTLWTTTRSFLKAWQRGLWMDSSSPSFLTSRQFLLFGWAQFVGARPVRVLF
jgi:hypothetical protein